LAPIGERFIAADTSALVRANPVIIVYPGIGVSLLSLTDPQPQQRRDRRQPLRHQHRLLPLTRLDRTDQEIRRGFFEHMFGYATAH